MFSIKLHAASFDAYSRSRRKYMVSPLNVSSSREKLSHQGTSTGDEDWNDEMSHSPHVDTDPLWVFEN